MLGLAVLGVSVAAIVLLLLWRLLVQDNNKKDKNVQSSADAPAAHRSPACSDPEVQRVVDKYGLEEYGFMPERNLDRLPKYFEPWEAIADKLPQHNRMRTLEAAVDALPMLDVSRLRGKAELRRAYTVLGFISHSYIHGRSVPFYKWFSSKDEEAASGPTAQPRDRLPVQLAAPWLRVSEELEIAPVLTHAAVDLWNWRLVDPTKPLSVDNLRCRVTATGGMGEEYFYLLVTAMEARAASLVPRCFLVADYIKAGRDDDLVRLLNEIASCLRDFCTIFARSRKLVDKDFFFLIHRPFLQGFQTETSLDGVEFEIGEGKTRTLRLKGGSAAQSSVIQMFDLVLGVDQPRLVSRFQAEMWAYMPGKHRLFLQDLQKRLAGGSLGAHVKELQKSPLTAAFNRAVDGLKLFRQTHLDIAKRYIQSGQLGTGTTPFKNFLETSLKATQRRRLPCCTGSFAPHPMPASWERGDTKARSSAMPARGETLRGKIQQGKIKQGETKEDVKS